MPRLRRACVLLSMCSLWSVSLSLLLANAKLVIAVSVAKCEGASGTALCLLVFDFAILDYELSRWTSCFCEARAPRPGREFRVCDHGTGELVAFTNNEHEGVTGKDDHEFIFGEFAYWADHVTLLRGGSEAVRSEVYRNEQSAANPESMPHDAQG